jgi:Uma2 family endonuclease
MSVRTAIPRRVAASNSLALRQRPEESRVLISAVDWNDYLALGRALEDRPNLRLTYDRGALEIMTTSHEHEAWKKRLNRLIEMLLDELGMPFESGGNMTFQREDLACGIESDDCYWIANEPAMRGRDDFKPLLDPPPDLALEIEYSRSALNRMAIYAALRIPEVWRYDGRRLSVHVLVGNGYVEQDQSPTFPVLPVRDIPQFLVADRRKNSLMRRREFLMWVRRHLLPTATKKSHKRKS